MRILVVALGSRGDTQPYLAVALELKALGHEVVVCAGDNFEAFITSYGLEFAPLGLDLQHIMNVELMDLMASGRNLPKAVRMLTHQGVKYYDVMWRAILEAARGCDAIVASTLGMAAHMVAELLDLPLFWAHTIPLIGPTRTTPPMLSPIKRSLGGALNMFQHRLLYMSIWQFIRSAVNRARAEQGLPKFSWRSYPFNLLKGKVVPHLHGYSPILVPRPPDWDPQWIVTGYWFLDEPDNWQPPAELVDFLDAGKPPVYIGFGSMSNRDPETMTEMVLKAIKMSGERALIFTGWGGVKPSDVPDDVFLMEDAPHSWIFPRMSAVVHHGGAGTTAAGLRAGVPTLVVPHFGDQFFWGHKIEALGVGCEPLPRKSITAEALSQRIQLIANNPEMRTNAAKLGHAIRAQNGKWVAADFIHQTLTR